jgi:hypothetical protein
LEVDSRAGDKVVHHVEHQDFVAEGMAGDARRIVWTPIRTRIGGELSANALPISRWIACAHATPRRALENASIDPRPVSRRPCRRAPRWLLNDGVVSAQDIDVGLWQ